jgi:actin-like ATPase involved in cell morphogenesis
MQIDDGNGNTMRQQWRGTDFQNAGLKLKIDVGASSEYSETLTMTTLDKLHDNKEIDTKTYIELAPENIVPFKEELLKKLEQQQNQLTPEEQQTLSQLPPEQQQQIMQQMQSSMMQGGQGMNNQNMMQGNQPQM